MNGTNVTHAEPHESHRGRLLKGAAGGLMVEAIGGIAVVVLSIIALAGALRADFMAISVILIGASLLFDGGAMAARYREAFSNLEGTGAGASEFGGAVMIDFLAGFAGIVLGILALLGMAPVTLISTAVIIFGCACLLCSGPAAHLNSLSTSGSYASDQSRSLMKESADTVVGGHALVGLTAVVLGILALLGINSAVLNLVALLALGVSVWLSGTAFGTKTMLESKRT